MMFEYFNFIDFFGKRYYFTCFKFFNLRWKCIRVINTMDVKTILNTSENLGNFTKTKGENKVKNKMRPLSSFVE